MFTPPLTTYFIQKHDSRAYPNKEQCFTCGFENLVVKAKEEKFSLFPNGLLSQLQNIGISLGNGKQEDAHEFLRFVVDTMQSVCIKASEYTMPKTRKLEDTTLIGLTFGGYLRSKAVTSDVERILNKGAYMLFYARCSPMSPRLLVCNKTEASNKKSSVPVRKTTARGSVSTASNVRSSNTPGGDRTGNI